MIIKNKIIGNIKPMHCVNNGPTRKEKNLRLYGEAGIPYMRNHDAAYATVYGREHTVDVHNIFRNFDADAYDMNNYDFVHTDDLIQRTLGVGTKTFYRLGTSIEGSFLCHYGTVPPKDNKKWAIICEQIIRHINEEKGFGIEYWEIWNEPDPWGDTERNANTWDGTKEEFFEFYETAAKHLKAAFPNLKIGGPAAAGGNDKWLEEFLSYCRLHNVPLDFFSWHIYNSDTELMGKRVINIKKMLSDHAFDSTESILNEWNFEVKLEQGEDKFARFRTNAGAAYTADFMLRCQNLPVDMLMYYDARPGTSYNGLFDFYTGEPFGAYYALRSFSYLYKSGHQLEINGIPKGITAVAAEDGAGNAYVMAAYYTDREQKPDTELSLSFEGYTVESVYLTDAENLNTETVINAKEATVSMKCNSFILVKAKA